MVDAVDNINNKATQLVAKETLVETNYEGHRYSCSEYSARWILGAIALIFSFGLAYLSKDVVALFAKRKKVEPLQISNDPVPTPVAVPIPKEDKPAPLVKEEIKQVVIPIPVTELKNEVKPELHIPLAEPEKEEVVSDPEPKVEVQEVQIESKVELSPEKKLLLEQYTQPLVEVLGGIDVLYNLPVLENWNGILDKKYLTAPVMRGSIGIDKPFLVFCYLRCAVGKKFSTVCEFLGKRYGKDWEAVCEFDTERQMDLRSPDPIADNSEEAKYMLDKIRRLMNGEPVGQVNRFPRNGNQTPDELESYLKGDELSAYMKLNNLNHYEKEPKKGTTELFLWDPKKTKLENKERLREKFPTMV